MYILPIKDKEVKDMTLNTNMHKRITDTICCKLYTTERKSITTQFDIYLKS